MRRVLAACALLAAACQPPENIAEVVEPTIPPETTVQLTSTTTTATPTTVLASEPTTTTTPVPVSVPEPILCPQLSHPQHHDNCPVDTLPRPTATTSAINYIYNGWAIPEYIVACETGGTFSWTAYNPSGASGPYQLMPMHFGGELAMNQPREAQHAKAAQLWNGGRGKSHWSACL